MKSKGNIIFCIAFSIYLATMIFTASMFGNMQVFSFVLKLARCGAYVLLLWKIVMENQYSSGQIVRYGIGAVGVLIVYYYSRYTWVVFLFLFLLACADVCFQDILRTYLWTNGIGIAIVVMSSVWELIPARNSITEERQRYAIGFDYVTTGANYWMYWVLAYTCFRKKKITLVEAVILEAITWLFYVLTDTKNAFAIATLAIIAALFLKVWNGRLGRDIFTFFIKNMTILGTCLMGGLIYFFDKSEFVSTTVNDLLTNRLSLSYEGIQNYGIHLFGQAIEWVGGTVYYDTETDFSSYNYVDSSYIQILLSYGIIFLIVLLIGYHLLGKRIVERQEWYLGLVIVLSAVHSMFDPQLLWLQYDVFILCLGYLFITDKDRQMQYLFE